MMSKYIPGSFSNNVQVTYMHTIIMMLNTLMECSIVKNLIIHNYKAVYYYYEPTGS